MGLPGFGRAAAISIVVTLLGCGTVRQVTEALIGIERLQFRLHGIRDFTLAGIPLAQRQTVGDVTVAEATQLLTFYRRGTLPAEFTVEIAVRNPNDGREGRRRIPITLTEMEWRLLIDAVPTVTGSLPQPIEVPAAGEAIVFPLRVRMDLYQFFYQRHYEDVLRLALDIAGVGGDASRVTVEVQPTLSTPLGRLRYPQPVQIVQKEFRP
ncbi:MAG: hypothetical protein NZ473_06355 [Candidatus Kapabacteria bacterium]|nr:hypothetical protein [Candidatus Kapabacteria bacterium]MCS7169139.1 hypothetical protein [Candidatus Kapabacteria bacterium]MDW7996472.1 hypothetical protein [Bacteroidota bacterium]MDW8225909.1 hypothetical protein [Bacteroidota bacterium]